MAARTEPSPLIRRLQRVVDLSEASDRAISILAGLDPSALGLILSNKRPHPGAETIGRLAAALGCSTDWLIQGAGEAPCAEQVRASIARAQGRSAAAVPSAADPLTEVA